ncbi:MAG TPA: LysR family transcriptional regulator [Pseudolabrys sp.]|nr:LysR family transcriptional regulator [Pseudolabrys sp.]
MIRHDLQTLRIFLAACELRSISKAAESLNIAVSAASRRLSLLEQEAKVPLVVRRSHGIEPTAAGITMMNYARDVLRLGDKVRTSLDEHRLGVRGYVRVSASSSALVQHLAKDLSAFAQANPEIKLDLQERPTNATIAAVLNKESDIGIIVRGPNPHAALEVTDYASDRLVVALPLQHPLARRRSLRFADIVDEDAVSLESDTATYRLMSTKAAELGRSMRVRVEVRSFEVMCTLVGQGLGYGVLPEPVARLLGQSMGLVVLRLAERWAERHHSICVRAREDMALPARRLVNFLLSRGGKTGSARKMISKK